MVSNATDDVLYVYEKLLAKAKRTHDQTKGASASIKQHNYSIIICVYMYVTSDNYSTITTLRASAQVDVLLLQVH